MKDLLYKMLARSLGCFTASALNSVLFPDVPVLVTWLAIPAFIMTGYIIFEIIKYIHNKKEMKKLHIMLEIALGGTQGNNES